MKKKFIVLMSVGILLTLAGCQEAQEQAQKLRKEGEKTVQDASKELADTQKQIMDSKAHIDKKMEEAQDIVDAVKKFSE